jgi:hypothetical protein
MEKETNTRLLLMGHLHGSIPSNFKSYNCKKNTNEENGLTQSYTHLISLGYVVNEYPLKLHMLYSWAHHLEPRYNLLSCNMPVTRRQWQHIANHPQNFAPS